MGSSGTGSFSDYSDYKPSNSGNQGGSSGEDRCNRAFSTRLDEVGRSDFFQQNNDVPSTNSQVSITMGTRLEVRDADNIVIGFLPTSFNYLALCISNGFRYEDRVSSSTISPVPSIEVDIIPLT